MTIVLMAGVGGAGFIGLCILYAGKSIFLRKQTYIVKKTYVIPHSDGRVVILEEDGSSVIEGTNESTGSEDKLPVLKPLDR
ncbi:hypothetical protein HYT92_00040 [Candidatus Pacearchaeota archaeon]|nr:hypothetical protein [Candidatus Pacearchaeota archaeon]